MSLKEFLQYLATPIGLGALATWAMYLIQKARPSIQNDLAFVVSVVVSAVIGIGAYFMLPFADKLPLEIATVVWPVLVWAWNYVIFRFGPKRAREVK